MKFKTGLNVSTSSSVLSCLSQPTTPLQNNTHSHLHNLNGIQQANNTTTVSRSSSATNFSMRTYNKSKSSLTGTTTGRIKTSNLTSTCSASTTSLSPEKQQQQELDRQFEMRIAAIYSDDFDDDDFYTNGASSSHTAVAASSSSSSPRLLTNSNNVVTSEIGFYPVASSKSASETSSSSGASSVCNHQHFRV